MHVDVPWYEAPSKRTPSCTKQEQIPGTHTKNLFIREGQMARALSKFDEWPNLGRIVIKLYNKSKLQFAILALLQL